ncbi:MAG TPA: transporter substrate-binding domain-containing protein [Alphaproteobacteria bacterium]
MSFLISGLPQAHAADESVMDRVLATNTIRCGYFLWPTYISKDANTKKLSGLNYDLMEAIGKNLGLKIDWVAEVGVGDVAMSLNTGKIDVMCATVWPSPGRIKSATLTIPEFYNVAYAYVRADDKRFDSDLNKANHADVKVSAIDGDYSSDLLKEKLPKATPAMLSQMASGSEILLQVVSKKADIAFVDASMVNDFLKTNPGTLRQVAGIPPIRFYGECLSVKRGEMELKNMLDLSILQLANDGSIDKLVQKYRKENNATFFSPAKTFIAQ